MSPKRSKATPAQKQKQTVQTAPITHDETTFKCTHRSLESDEIPRGQPFGLHQFVPAYGATPDERGVYGLVQFCGAFQTTDGAELGIAAIESDAEGKEPFLIHDMMQFMPLSLDPKFLGDPKVIKKNFDGKRALEPIVEGEMSPDQVGALLDSVQQKKEVPKTINEAKSYAKEIAPLVDKKREEILKKVEDKVAEGQKDQHRGNKDKGKDKVKNEETPVSAAPPRAEQEISTVKTAAPITVEEAARLDALGLPRRSVYSITEKDQVFKPKTVEVKDKKDEATHDDETEGKELDDDDNEAPTKLNFVADKLSKFQDELRDREQEDKVNKVLGTPAERTQQAALQHKMTQELLVVRKADEVRAKLARFRARRDEIDQLNAEGNTEKAGKLWTSLFTDMLATEKDCRVRRANARSRIAGDAERFAETEENERKACEEVVKLHTENPSFLQEWSLLYIRTLQESGIHHFKPICEVRFMSRPEWDGEYIDICERVIQKHEERARMRQQGITAQVEMEQYSEEERSTFTPAMLAGKRPVSPPRPRD